MQTIDQQIYDDWKNKQKDAYSLECFNFAERWANEMELQMGQGKELKDIAEKISYKVANGITGFMYGMGVSILSHCWIHGEQLRVWHNLHTQIYDEGEKANEDGGVLNPALLSIIKG